jgi:hypothetical protein
MIRDNKHQTNIPLSTFQKLIDYFYCNLVDLSISDAGQILSFAEYYQLTEEKPLIELCQNKLKSVNGSNWQEAYALGLELQNEELMQTAMNAIPSSISINALALYFHKMYRAKLDE